MTPNPALTPLDRVLGTWHVTGSHPYLPGRTLRGRVSFERVEGGAFVRVHTVMEDAEIPEGVAYLGTDGTTRACTMLYFDVRGVARHYAVRLAADGFGWSREAPDLSQRYEVRIAADGRTMEGQGSMKKGSDGEWEGDLSLTYRREDA